MQYRSTSVRAVIQRGNQILVEWLPSKGISFLPGGGVNEGEGLQEALERELAEELSGITVAIGRYLGRIGHVWMANGSSDSCLNHFFEVEILDVVNPAAREAGRTVQWLDLASQDLATLQPPSLQRLLGKPPGLEWDLVDSPSAVVD